MDETQETLDETITANNVEEELKKLKIIDDYDSDEYEHVNKTNFRTKAFILKIQFTQSDLHDF
jgi:hypothetical protein